MFEANESIASENIRCDSKSSSTNIVKYVHVDLAGEAMALLAFLSLLFLYFTRELRKEQSSSESSFEESKCEESSKWKRKQDFLTHVGDAYGYRGTRGGFIDDWRSKEFPALIKPLSRRSQHGCDDSDDEGEIYLDYAGSALPTKSQLEEIFTNSCATTLANPHSSGPAASRTLAEIEKVKNRILRHFHAAPGRFASLHPASSPSLHGRHSGYDILFTSGATEALRIVAERFPWSRRCEHCGRQSILLYAQNSHSSVVGMRELAISHGAAFYCYDMNEIEKMDKDAFESLEEQSRTTSEENWKNCSDCQEKKICNLLVFPAECNFGGHRPESRSILSLARENGWFTMLDIAKAASTGPVNLQEENPDFACVSYYKLFGEPTGLGSLFAKRSTSPLLFESKQRHYVGGGSLNIILAKRDFQSQSNNLGSLTNGSTHFRGILKLSAGFDEIDRLGGMTRIHSHATALSLEFQRRLKDLVHGNGRPAIVIYGAWRNPSETLKPGPTISFNILRDDETFVGYNEVSKLAALHKPAIQFRTGCFCNPGACQQALDLTGEQLIHNFEVAGHVCGDHIDIVDERPTGAIRISFGKDSIWEDLDELVVFIEKTFVNKFSSSCSQETVVRNSTAPARVTLRELYIFPIKSCAAQRTPRWKIDLPNGKLLHDREFALVDTSGTVLRLQNCPQMGMISPVVDLERKTLTVKAPGCTDLVLSMLESASSCGRDNEVSVCGNKCDGRLWGGYEASEWFTSFLGIQCWLARYSKSTAFGNPKSSFANEKPLLLISDNAVQALNQVLADHNQKLVGPKHFRPNLVVRSPQNEISHVEDDWKKLVLGNESVAFEVKGGCARCSMVDYDPSNGSKGKTLRALAKYRRRKGQITFGIFLQAVAEEKEGSENLKGVWIQEGEKLRCDY